MKQEKYRPGEDTFSLERFRSSLPALREEFSGIDADNSANRFISTITDEDLLEIYTDWLYRKKIKDRVEQNGFVFEILCRRYIESLENPSRQSNMIKELIMFLNQTANNLALWGEEKSTPDDLGIRVSGDRISIYRIYEAKISVHCLQRSYHQRERTWITIQRLVSALNGVDVEVKTASGAQILATTLDELDIRTSLPVELSRDCRYVYLLPADQIYINKLGHDHFDTLNIPLGTGQVERFREIVIGFFGRNFGT